MVCLNVFLLVVFSALSAAVKITKFTVPRTAVHDAFLDCAYDLEGDTLYDVKWYKDSYNFFRCYPSGKVSHYEDVGVEILYNPYAPLGSCSVTLIMLNSKSAGEYKCEVTAEAPSFNTAIKASKLRIVDPLKLPKRVENRSKLHGEENLGNQVMSVTMSANSLHLNWYNTLLFILIYVFT